MPDDPIQTDAESPAGSGSEPTASATGAAPDAFDMDAAFASITGASNSGNDPATPTADPAQPATSAAPDKGAASNAAGAPSGEEPKPTGRDPQPDSRRSTAAEIDSLRKTVEEVIAQRDATAKELADKQASDAKASEAVEILLGKPGELAALQIKQAGWIRGTSQDVFTAEDEQRLAELVHGTQVYAPLQARAIADAQAHASTEIGKVVGQRDAILGLLAQQIQTCADLPGIDAAILKDEPDLSKIVRHAHAAGAASRDDEVADLSSKLLQSRGQAFVSQPPLAAGGTSGAGGRPGLSYNPEKSPQTNLEDIFATSSNGSGRH